MAQRFDRRPGDKSSPELPQERLARDKAEVNLDTRTRDARRALEAAEVGQEVSAEAAAQLQRTLGNAALQGMVKEGTDTATGTAEIEIEQEEEEEQEQDDDKEAGELERVLPSFSMGGGGGGTANTAPWAMGRMFGGDGEPEAAAAATAAKWRPMPLPPDPDDDEPDAASVAEEAAGETPWDGMAQVADARFGELPWSAGVLSRGLRHSARLTHRRVINASGDSDAVWSRARAALRFLGNHAPHDEVRALAAGGARIGILEEQPLVLALAQDLAILEAALAKLGPEWRGVVEAAADLRARPRAEAAAAELPAGRLCTASVLAAALGSSAAPADGDDAETAHPAALAAVQAAARLAPLPRLELWHRPELAVDAVDPVVAALDALLAAETRGREADSTQVAALYEQLTASLTAFGAIHVEIAAAAIAAWPWLSDGVAEAAAARVDERLRDLARRLVRAGRSIEAAVAAGDLGGIERAAAEAAGIAAAAGFVRTAALTALAGPLLDPACAVAPTLDRSWAARQAAGKGADLRAELERTPPFLAFARRADLDGALVAGAALAEASGDAALLHVGSLVSVGNENAAAVRLAAWVGQGDPGPYALVWAAILGARSRRDPDLLVAAGAAVRAHEDAGALNLLKAAWLEFTCAPPGEG